VPHRALYVGSYRDGIKDNEFYGIDSETGNILWTGAFVLSFWSPPSVSPDGSKVYTGNLDGNLYALQ
jgi:outer membrane protein assembly factor BamB